MSLLGSAPGLTMFSNWAMRWAVSMRKVRKGTPGASSGKSAAVWLPMQSRPAQRKAEQRGNPPEQEEHPDHTHHGARQAQPRIDQRPEGVDPFAPTPQGGAHAERRAQNRPEQDNDGRAHNHPIKGS